LAINFATGLTMPTAPELTSRRQDRRITIAVCIVLTLLVWLVFAQTLRYDFVNFDDDRYVYENSEVSRGFTVDGFKWLLTHSHASLWHPLTTLSHMLDCQIYGLKPAGHHFTNVLLHSVAVILLFLVFCRMTGRVYRSAFVAAIFAIHPTRVESVAWIAERKDVLSGVFFMLTLASYAHYARAPSIRRYVAMSTLLACGLMSKATFVTVPAVLLLLDYWPLRRASDFSGWRRLVIEKIPLLGLSAAAAVITMFAQTATMATLDQLPFRARLNNAVVSVVVYLRQTFWPTGLAVFYPHPHNQLNVWVVSESAILIVVITLIAIFLRQKRPYLFVGWFWFLILVFPVLGFFQAGLQGRADRFTYLPHIGITIALTWAVADLTQQWRNQRALLASAATCIVIACALCAWKQTSYWHDSISLWGRALAVTSNNQIAHQDLAAALWARGRIAEARTHARAADIIHARTTLGDHPFDIPVRDNLGVLLIQSGDAREAIVQWDTNLKIDPNDGNALNNLAWVLATCPDDSIRNGKRAVELAEKAVTLPSGDAPVVLRTLGAAYAENNDFPKAMATVQRAIDLATGQGNSSLTETLRHELEFYQAQKPYRESPTN
jgi:tetratricopeptide (TPR) repeat protein